jgi:hypothetical protein
MRTTGQFPAEETERGEKGIEQPTSDFFQEHAEIYAKGGPVVGFSMPVLSTKCLVLRIFPITYSLELIP